MAANANGIAIAPKDSVIYSLLTHLFEKVTKKNIMLTFVIVPAILITVSWLVIIFHVRQLQVKYDVGKQIRQFCGNRYAERETARNEIYEYYKSSKLDESTVNSLNALIAGFALIMFYFMVFITVFVPIKAGDLVRHLFPKNYSWHQFIVIMIVVLTILIQLTVYALAMIQALKPFSSDTMAQYGIPVATNVSEEQAKQATFQFVITLLIIIGIIFIIKINESVLPLLMLFILIIGSILLSVLYNYYKSTVNLITVDYSTQVKNLNDIFYQNALTTPDVANYFKANIKRLDSVQEDVRIDDYKDRLYQYVIHADGREEIGFTDQRVDDDVKQRLRQLRAMEPQVQKIVRRFTIMVFGISLVLGLVGAYAGFHWNYVYATNFPRNLIIVVFIVLFLTVLYTWFTGSTIG